MVNHSKRAKCMYIRSSRIMHAYMNTSKGIAKFKNFQILLDSGCSSTIVMRRLLEKLYPEKYAVIQWQTQAGKITTNLKITVDFILLALSATNFVTWKCHVDVFARDRYDMVLGRDILK